MYDRYQFNYYKRMKIDAKHYGKIVNNCNLYDFNRFT